MLNWVITFFVMSIVAGILGFGGLAGDMEQIAKILFVIFLVLFALSFIRHRGNVGIK